MPDSLVARRLTRLILAGIVLAAGGISLYVPLVLAAVGAGFSGTWAATIIFATNLGRVIGSFIASRQALFTERPAALVATILLEGVALFAMAFASAPLAYGAAALAAGLGSGMSFPGMKAWLLRIPGGEPSRVFAELSLAMRLGMLWGYVAGAFVPPGRLLEVFSVVLVSFVAYAAAMGLATRRITALAQAPSTTPVPRAGDAPTPPDEPVPIGLRTLIALSALFWLLMIQPTVAMSLHVPRYVPELPVQTTYWVMTLTILLLQTRVTPLARGLAGHARYLRLGFAVQGAGFALMALAGTHATAVVIAAVLLALGQVLFVPSSDVLLTAIARARGLAPGPLMARQLVQQNLGVMLGALAAGALFDLGVAHGWPALSWSLLALASAAALALSVSRHRARHAAQQPSA